ncbi:MAG TPA: hypothetical protein VEZ88_04820 [Steroidobacteraceae bacterium]|nr:hypothetical protein [Steroidobacteraceae bacterium]
MKMLLGCLLCAMVLAACGQDTPPKEEQPMRVEDTFAGDLIQQKEKITDQAQKQVESRMPELNREIDQASGEQPSEPQD